MRLLTQHSPVLRQSVTIGILSIHNRGMLYTAVPFLSSPILDYNRGSSVFGFCFVRKEKDTGFPIKMSCV